MSTSIQSLRSEDGLPDYSPAATDNAELPQYSSKPHQSEYVLDFDIVCFCNRGGGRHVYESQDMIVDLGSRLWSIETPSYGSEGVVKGSVVVKDKSISSATHLSVGLVITVSGSGRKPRKLWSQKTEIDNLSKQSYRSGESIGFQLTIPPEIEVDGYTIKSPPSLLVKAREAKIVVDYRIVVSLGKKGILQSTSSLKIPILHLPKTRPPVLTRNDIPTADCIGQPYMNDTDIHTTVVKIDGFSMVAQSEQPVPLEVYYSRPIADCFASGSTIPIVLTVKNLPTEDSKEFLKYFAQSTSVTLYKHTNVVSSIASFTEHVRLGSIPSFSTRNLGGDAYQLHGTLDTGCGGCETSWRIPGVVQVRYMISVQSHPSSDHPFPIPQFSHRDFIQLTTDPWGTHHYELNVTSGLPVPALGLSQTHTCAFCRSPSDRGPLEVGESPTTSKITT